MDFAIAIEERMLYNISVLSVDSMCDGVDFKVVETIARMEV